MVDGVKISQLPQLISADVDDTDELVIVDVSEGVSKKITRSKLLGSAFPTVDINGGTIDGTVIGGTTPAAVTGTTITAASFVSSGNMTFGDNDKALFGAGSDLQIYHSGNQSYIDDTGTGNLILRGNAAVSIQKYTGEILGQFTADGSVTLYYDNAAKLATTSTGISVTGTATASGFTGDLTGDVTGDLTGNVTSTGSSTFSNLDVTTLSIGSTAITATAAELNYVDGVTSNIQTQLDTKLSNITGQSIKNLSDVYSLMAPSDGQILVWDSVNSRWQAEDNTGGGGGGAATLSGVLANGNTTGGYDINVNSGSYITFGDNNKAVFGAGSDLEIYSDGTTGQITGNVNVTGTLTSDGLTVDGGATVNANVFEVSSTAPNIRLTETDTTDENTQLFNGAGTFRIRTASDDYSTTTERMRIDHATGDISFYEDTGTTAKFFWDASAESLGIGDTAPSEKLNVAGNIMLEGANQYLYLTNVGTGNSGIYLRGITADSTLRSHSTGIFTWEVTGNEKMRIDSSGNLLVGKSTTAIENVGTSIFSTGRIISTANNDDVLVLRRNSSDGDLISLRKDGTTVGSIGTAGSSTYVTGASSGLRFASTNILPANASGSFTDNTSDLGGNTERFKDLYLSGGVFLGGTGAANQLSDYEEGTWSVTLTPSTSGTISLGAGGGAFYTKVGQTVHISISVTNNSSSSPVGYIGFNLPFAAASGSQKGRSALALYFDGVASSNVADFIGLTIDGTSEGRIYLGDNPIAQSDSAQQMDGTCYILISGSYITSA